jgi:hypothetical protein
VILSDNSEDHVACFPATRRGAAKTFQFIVILPPDFVAEGQKCLRLRVVAGNLLLNQHDAISVIDRFE